MPKVLVIGATGYIGRALALSLLRSGNHVVYGLARTPEKAKELAAMEIIPVRGSANESEEYLALIRNAHIDIVVDAAGTHDGGFKIVNDIRQAGEERLARAKEIGVPLGGARLGFVYTSGEWVHGTTLAGEVINDLDPVAVQGAGKAPDIVAWRADLEKAVLNASDVLDVAVVRPAVVYGGNSWIFNGYFAPLEASALKDPAADVVLPAESDNLIGLVHVDDAGTGLHAVVDKLPLLRGTGVWPVFDLTASVESIGALLLHAAKALGVEGKVNFTTTEKDPLANAICTSVLTSSGRAKSILGWEPKRIGMTSHMELYAQAWKASKKE
jgi:nucleoside-diphosphate-sugar epimerase